MPFFPKKLSPFRRKIGTFLRVEALELRVVLHGLAPGPGILTLPDADDGVVAVMSSPPKPGTRGSKFDPGSDSPTLVAVADESNLAPGQVNGSAIFGGGIYGAAAASFTTQANGLPILNSNPTAKTAVYLDFEGYTGPDYGGGTDNFAAYDTTGNAAVFDSTEQANIAEGWRRIASEFANFDVNVTTIKPTVPFSWSVISYGVSGGYSYLSFNGTKPSAFNYGGDLLGRTSGILHEIGHNFSLVHQGTYDLLANHTAEYTSKTDNLHGAIMGVDYDGTVTKWKLGHPSATSGAITLQDDLTIIAGKIKPYEATGGDGYHADDYGGTIATATPLTVSGSTQSIYGVIERLTDSDVFSFTSSGFGQTITATPDSPSGLDAVLEIYDGSGNLLAAADTIAQNYQTITMTLPAGTYDALVRSHGNYDDIGAYQVKVAPSTALPAGWTSKDIGTVGKTGSSLYDAASDTYTIAGSGTDIYGTVDAFQYASQTLAGDGSIVAQVTSMTNTNVWAKTGLMFRDGTASNAKEVSLVMSYGNGPQFLARSTAGGTTTSYAPNTGTAFVAKWLKLTRAGNVFTGYTSTDGTTWTQFSQATVTMSANVSVGLISGAVNNSSLNSGTLTGVALTGALVGTAINSLLPPTNPTIALGTGIGLNLSWDAVAGATGYQLERSFNGVDFATVTTVTSPTTSYSDNTLTGSYRYFYRVKALDATGESVPSTIVNAVDRPSAITNFTIDAVSNTSLVLDWTDTSGETGYRIERSTDGGTTYTTIASVATNVPSYTDTGLTAGTTYTYRVTPTSALGDGPSLKSSAITRLPVVAGMTFDSIGSTQAVFHWGAVVGATTYRIDRSTDGTTFTTLTSTNSTTSYTDSTVSAQTEYYYRVEGIAGSGLGVYPSPIFAAAPAATALPGIWSAQDIGAVTGSGATGYSAGTFTVISSGADIWGTADAFRYTYQPLVGDGSIIARVASVENTGGWVKAGVMIRESLAANSRQIFVAITPSNGVAEQYRTTTGGSSVNTNTTGISAPYWVRIARVGNVFTGSYSSDGATWTQIGTPQTIAMGAAAYVGLSSDANVTTLLNTSKFDNVTVSNAAPTVAAAPAASPSTVAGKTTTLSVLGADDHGEANLTYTWATIGSPPATVTFSANGTNAAKSSTATFAAAGSYTFQVTITDSSSLTITGTVNVTVAQTLTSISVSAASANVGTTQTVQLSAVGLDQFGGTLTSQPGFAWTASGVGGAVDSNGLLTAGSTIGSETVTATSGSVAGSKSVSIVAPPQFMGASINAGDTQRSELTSLVVSFDSVVDPTMLAGAFTLNGVDVSGNALGTPTIAVAAQTVGNHTLATLTFSGANTEGGNSANGVAPSLAEGNWTLSVNKAKVASTATGVPMSANASSANIKRLYGDINGDGVVNGTDLASYLPILGLTSADAGFATQAAPFDVNGDGAINGTDLARFFPNFGVQL